MALSKIQAESMNLADTFAFTGTVSGTDSSMEFITSASSTTDVSALEISLDYSDYDHFLLNLDILGTSTGTGQNLDVQWKRSGQSSFNSGSSDYSVAGHYHDGNTGRNQNSQNSMELFWTNEPAKQWTCSIWFWNTGNTTNHNKMQAHSQKVQTSGNSAYISSGAFNNLSNSEGGVIAAKFFFTDGDITEYSYQLYGVKTS